MDDAEELEFDQHSDDDTVIAQHAGERMEERHISIDNINSCKAEGTVSIVIPFTDKPEGPTMEKAEERLVFWGPKITQQFDGLVIGDTVRRGKEGDFRLEVPLVHSKERGLLIRTWLKGHSDYFSQAIRLVFSHELQRQAGHSRSMVVVEGPVSTDVGEPVGVTFGVVTVYLKVRGYYRVAFRAGRNSTGFVKWFGTQLLRLISKGDDADQLDSMLRDYARQVGGTWFIGPTDNYRLSEWHIDSIYSNRGNPNGSASYPILMWAATMGCPNMVDRLLNTFQCNVNVTQMFAGNDMGITALHLGAYSGHGIVVRNLLLAGADPAKKMTVQNLVAWTDITPRDSALAGQAKFTQSPTRAATYKGWVGGIDPITTDWKAGGIIDFRNRDPAWPEFPEILALLPATE